MKTVAIVDYGMGNVDSVARAVQECGAKAVVTADRDELESADSLILPGVGAFKDGMKHLRDRGLPDLLREQAINKRIPFLGICLGMQLMAKRGIESGDTEGLGWLDAVVVRLKSKGPDERIPHIGWNEVHPSRPSPLFTDIPNGKDFYFVHSYHLACKDKPAVLADTPYCGGFISAVAKDNLFGVQFHPEKSQKPGFQLLKNFLSL